MRRAHGFSRKGGNHSGTSQREYGYCPARCPPGLPRGLYPHPGHSIRGIAPDAQADPATLQGTSSLQHELAQLMYCYATGVDLARAGDGAAAAQQLCLCFTDDAESVYEFPPMWAHLNFTVTGGGAGLAQTAIEFYGKFGFTRTQHMVTNVVVQRTGETTAIMRSYALAIHTYPDESVWNATVKYLDDVHYINGQWKFVHRQVTLTSLTKASAWAGAPLGQ